MAPVPVFGSVGEALEMVRAGLAFVAAADATELSTEEQAEALRGLERANSVATAARTSVLTAFTTGNGYSADADYSVTAWLMHKTGVTLGAAKGHAAWVRRAARHPELFAGMAGEGVAAEILARLRPQEPDHDPDKDFEDRSVKLHTTFQGAGIIHGDLTPECASVVQAVLDALAAPAGSEDNRTKEQRYHDALHEAMRRLVTGGLLPERAGQPVKALVHISLADLMRLQGSSALTKEWIAGVRARWAAARAAASETGSDGGAWLDGDAAGAAACDASMIPVVTGEVDPGVLEELVRLCAHLDRLRRDGIVPTVQDLDLRPGTEAADGPAAPCVRDILEQKIIRRAVALVSGPGGLASFLRRGQLGTRLASPSLPWTSACPRISRRQSGGR